MATPGLNLQSGTDLSGFINPAFPDRGFPGAGGSTTTKQPEIGEPEIPGGFKTQSGTSQLEFGTQAARTSLDAVEASTTNLQQQVEAKAPDVIEPVLDALGNTPEQAAAASQQAGAAAAASAAAANRARGDKGRGADIANQGQAGDALAEIKSDEEAAARKQAEGLGLAAAAAAEEDARKGTEKTEKTEKTTEEAEAPVFTLKNPITGEVEEFDTPEKKTKREKQINEEIVDAENQDQLKKISQDFTTQSAEVILDLANPDTPDPIKTAQLNELIASFGPENQAAMDSMLLSLKQDRLAGSGAGNAMLLLMARGNKAQFSNMVQRLNTESAQRIVDMNKYGAEIGLRIRQQVNNEVQQKFQNDATKFGLAVEAGDFTAASNFASDMGLANLDMAKFEAMSDIELATVTDTFFKNVAFSQETADKITAATGITFDPKQYASIPAAVQETINNRLNSIDQLPTAEAKKQAMLALAQEFPETFGFPDDPESAVAMVNEMDFDNVAANAQALADATNFWRTEAITDSPNLEGIIAAGTGAWSSSSDAQIDNLFNSQVPKFDLLNEESQTLILDGMAQFGVNSTDDIDTREEKEAFLSLSRFDDQRQDVGGISAEIFENFGTIFQDTDLASWFDEADNGFKAGITKQWIAENIVFPGKFKTDPETGQLVPDVEGLAPPWSEEAAQYKFLTWPIKTWDEEGNVTTLYEGEEFRDDIETGSVLDTPEEIAEDQRLTNAFMDYKKNGGGDNWLEWYDNTQGGTKKQVEAFDAPTAEQQFVDTAISDFNAALDSGDFSAVSDDEYFKLFSLDPDAKTRMADSENVKNLTSGEITDNSIIRLGDFQALGLRADSEKSGGFKGGFGNKKSFIGSEEGVGAGNGSIIIIDGRPARITSFFSSAQGGRFEGVSARQGNIWVEYLDEDPETREEVRVGGSGDFVDV